VLFRPEYVPVRKNRRRQASGRSEGCGQPAGVGGWVVSSEFDMPRKGSRHSSLGKWADSVHGESE